MLKIFSPSNILAALRIMTGLLYLQHGMGKLFHWPRYEMYDQVTLFSFVGLAGVMELVGGILIALGLFTRVTAFILAGQMAVAYFGYHAAQSFFPLLNGGEPAILFCFIFLYLAAAGPGAFALDNSIGKRRR